MKISSWSFLAMIIFASACTTTRQINNNVNPKSYVAQHLLDDSTLQKAHVGVAVFDPATGTYLYNYQGDKYFTPASNVKLFSCYAAMKFLGDSIAGLYYSESDTALFLDATGDPTLLHPDFHNQPVIRLLQQTKKNIYINKPKWNTTAWGRGWSWDDYSDDYMVERSPLPVYGNVVEWVQENNEPDNNASEFGASASIYSNPEVNWKVRFSADTARHFQVQRELTENIFHVTQSSERKASQFVPFATNELQAALELLPDTIGKEISIPTARTTRKMQLPGGLNVFAMKPLYSQPLDSMLKPMMYRSDNFFAEQCLQMVSHQLFQGEFNERKVIDSMLTTSLNDLPQPPTWVDGSGLSRVNFFTPEDFVALLQKMEKEFGMDRLKGILATGGKGTLKNFYQSDSGYIYAKTGTLNGVVALSGYLTTRNNKKLIFSVLVNNHRGNAVAVRRKVEAFLTEIRREN